MERVGWLKLPPFKEPELRNITIKDGQLYARQPGDYTQRRKGIFVAGPNGELVTKRIAAKLD